jgi:hypothetical protein
MSTGPGRGNAQQPPSTARWINPDGTPSLVFFQYMKAMDVLLGLLATDQLGPLTNAANDTAAAAAGVAIGQLYRTTNAVQIRLV